MKLLCVLLVLTILSPCVMGKAVTSIPESRTGNEVGVELSNSVTGATETAEDIITEKEESLITTTTTAINPAINEVDTSSDEVPIFNRNQVTLDLPGDLFSSTANLTLRLRNFIGDFITRTSVRIAQVVRFFQPLFGYHLMIDIPKELDRAASGKGDPIRGERHLRCDSSPTRQFSTPDGLGVGI
uniref:SEA domain-containing protein n=1 Tax=Anopheles maculatus TaxID=74869 RepID=A0A182T1W8_9DIPT